MLCKKIHLAICKWHATYGFKIHISHITLRLIIKFDLEVRCLLGIKDNVYYVANRIVFMPRRSKMVDLLCLRSQ